MFPWLQPGDGVGAGGAVGRTWSLSLRLSEDGATDPFGRLMATLSNGFFYSSARHWSTLCTEPHGRGVFFFFFFFKNCFLGFSDVTRDLLSHKPVRIG